MTSAGRQRALNRFLTDRANITVDEIVIDSLGGQSPQSVSVASNVPCRLIRASQRDVAGIIGSQETINDYYRCIFSKGTPLGVNQKVTIDNRLYNLVGLTSVHTDSLDEQAILVRQL